MNETMLLDGPLMKDDPFYLDSTHWSCGGGGGGAGRFRDDPVKSYTMLTRKVCNTAFFSSTQFHAAQMTLNNSKMSELDSGMAITHNSLNYHGSRRRHHRHHYDCLYLCFLICTPQANISV